jgi:hypothetical protein
MQIAKALLERETLYGEEVVLSSKGKNYCRR